MNKFKKSIEEIEVRPLSLLTDGIHLHTISADSNENMQLIKEELKEKTEQLDRYHRIAKYIFNNYNNNITLQEIAKKEFLSPHYLSHEIKYATGYSFTDLINLTRFKTHNVELSRAHEGTPSKGLSRKSFNRSDVLKYVPSPWDIINPF